MTTSCCCGGVCCLPGGVCSGALTEQECIDQDGDFLPGITSCLPNPCPQCWVRAQLCPGFTPPALTPVVPCDQLPLMPSNPWIFYSQGVCWTVASNFPTITALLETDYVQQVDSGGSFNSCTDCENTPNCWYRVQQCSESTPCHPPDGQTRGVACEIIDDPEPGALVGLGFRFGGVCYFVQDSIFVEPFPDLDLQAVPTKTCDEMHESGSGDTCCSCLEHPDHEIANCAVYCGETTTVTWSLGQIDEEQLPPEPNGCFPCDPCCPTPIECQPIFGDPTLCEPALPEDLAPAVLVTVGFGICCQGCVSLPPISDIAHYPDCTPSPFEEMQINFQYCTGSSSCGGQFDNQTDCSCNATLGQCGRTIYLTATSTTLAYCNLTTQPTFNCLDGENAPLNCCWFAPVSRCMCTYEITFTPSAPIGQDHECLCLQDGSAQLLIS